MTREEQAIARAIAEKIGIHRGMIATDVGTIYPFLPPHRKNDNEFRVHNQARLDERGDAFDVEIIVKKRTGYIG